MMLNERVTLARRSPLQQVQADLALDSVDSVRRALAENPALDPGLALRLAVDPSPVVRLSLAWRPDASRDLLAILARDPDEEVRRLVANHPHPRMADLLALAADKVSMVAGTAVRNPRLPARFLTSLASSPDPMVRLAVAANTATPVAVLASLATDPYSAVRLAVAASEAMTDPAVLDALADDPLLRRVVAVKDATAAPTLARLVRDDDHSVVLSVAAHPGADEATLRYAASLGYPVVQVVGNPNAPWDLVVELCAAEWGMGCSMLADVARTRMPAGVGEVAWIAVVQQCAARGEHVPADMLAVLLSTAAALDAFDPLQRATFDVLFSRTPPGTPVADVLTLVQEVHPASPAPVPAVTARRPRSRAATTGHSR